MKKKIAAALLAGALLLSLGGCAAGGRDLTKGIASLPATADLPLEHTGTGAITDFGIRLLQSTAQPGVNTLVSPLSVQTALAMTMNGAEGDTLAEMEEVLGGERGQLTHLLGDYLKSVEGEQFHAANAIWFADRQDFTVKEDFLAANQTYFDAELYQAPMNSGTVKDINRWVSKHTHKMIPEIVDRLPQDALMCLVNALAFEGEWPKPYEDYQVRDGEFHREGKSPVEVEFLFGSDNLYLSGEGCTGFIKPYKGGRYAFAALLPEENRTVEELLASLDGEKLTRLLTHPTQEEVITRIPKFSTEYAVELSGVLSDMGMPLAFTGGADFSGIGETEEGLFIDQVLHKTFLELGEKGTRAGAATAVMLAEGAAPDQEEPKKVFLDRPFLYMLVDLEYHTPFFVGVMQDPGEGGAG